MSYWSFGKTMGLKGVEGTLEVLENCPQGHRSVIQPDPENPVVLQDEIILYALRTSRQARADFRRLFPTLLPAEQERLSTLLALHPRISALVQDDQVFFDRIQSKAIKSIPVRTTGPRGGKGTRGA
jgi:hypothetical protein